MVSPYSVIESILQRADEGQKIGRVDKMNYYRAKKEICLARAKQAEDISDYEWYTQEAGLCDKILEDLEFKVVA